MDTTTWSNMFSVRISSHNPFTNFGVTVGGPTMKFADLRAKAKPKACRKVAGSSSSSGGSSPGLDDSLQDVMMDHSPGRPLFDLLCIVQSGSENLSKLVLPRNVFLNLSTYDNSGSIDMSFTCFMEPIDFWARSSAEPLQVVGFCVFVVLFSSKSL